MKKIIKLKNISNSKKFGVSGGRIFSFNQVLEFEEKEASELLANWKGEIIIDGANIVSNQNNNETILLQQRIAELEKQLIEAKLEKEKTSDDEAVLISLKEEARSLGIDTRGRLSIETLQEKIKEAKEKSETINQF